MKPGGCGPGAGCSQEAMTQVGGEAVGAQAA